MRFELPDTSMKGLKDLFYIVAHGRDEYCVDNPEIEKIIVFLAKMTGETYFPFDEDEETKELEKAKIEMW